MQNSNICTSFKDASVYYIFLRMNVMFIILSFSLHRPFLYVTLLFDIWKTNVTNFQDYKLFLDDWHDPQNVLCTSRWSQDF